MSRGWINGIVSLAICITWVSACNAQSERSEGPSGAVSLSDRLAALRGKFRRDEGQSASQQKPAKRKPLLSGVNPGALLPDHFFGRQKQQERSASPLDEVPQAYDPAELARVTTAPRSGSNSIRKPFKQLDARKSPTTRRTNELDAALADLIPEEESQAVEQSVTEITDIERAPRQSTRSVVPRARVRATDDFDLHQALVGDLPEEAVAEDQEETAGSWDTDEATVTDEETNFLGQPAEPIAEPVLATPSQVVEESQTVMVPSPTSTSLPREEPVAQPELANTYESAAEKAFSSSSSRPSRNSATRRRNTDLDRRRDDIEGQASNEDRLLSYQQPVIVSHVEGPRRIMVGREATYRVRLENTSSTNAKSLAAAIRVPNWAEIVDVMSTSGAVDRVSQGTEADVLEWKLNDLAAESSETLRLRLIPRSGRPFQLGVEWSQAPSASATMVEVQEPKLQLDIGGPQEVLFGKPQRYRLTLSNPGTGQAEQVVIQLIPPGGDAKSVISHPIGTLKPSEVRNIDLELTAREAGELVVQASAAAEGGLSAEAVKNVLCRKPELQVDWRGPETKYAGTVAAYYFRVRNPGTASTDPVNIRVKLPKGAKFVAASDGHRYDSEASVVTWQLPGIGADQEQFMQVRCQVDQPGANVVDVTAQTADGDLSDSKTIETKVVALADLKLEVNDPQGPIPLGEAVLYEIRVRNRGTTAANGINVVGLFSSGIEPTSVEGAQYAIRDGRVTFHPIKSLPAGREVILRIRAVANDAGTHVFRAEVACEDLDIKLAAEETTRFFEDEYRWEDGKTPYSAEHSDSVAR